MVNKVVILGAGGRIGQALCKVGQHLGMEVIPINRVDSNAWNNQAVAKEGLDNLGIGQSDLLICAAGIINPKAERSAIDNINYDLAVGSCRAARTLGARAVSLGTVLETVIPAEAQNAYVASKTRLQAAAKGNWLHLHLHTIYGGLAPTPFMFAGLMFEALLKQVHFPMTSGEQLREYHHVDDEAKAIMLLAGHLEEGCIDVSHGRPIKLCNLAEGVFSYFDKLDLLGIGDLKSPVVEAYEPVFTRQSYLKDLEFRPAVPAVAEWFAEYLQTEAT